MKHFAPNKFGFAFRLAFLLLLGSSLLVGCQAEKPRNVIVLIGDGMGFEQTKAASIYAYGRDGRLAMQRLPYRGELRTYPANGENEITDSAAGGTAIATGRKVYNGVVSMAIPGDGTPLLTALEYSRDEGKMTGLVTTAYITHATPATFGAHAENRGMLDKIAQCLLEQSRPNVLFGGFGGRSGEVVGVTREKAEAAGYKVVTSRDEMNALTPAPDCFVSGQFGPGGDCMPYEYDYAVAANTTYDTQPHLSEMTRKALELLDAGPNGFFLMVEGGRIDHAGHENRLPHNIYETLEFDMAVKVVLDWAKDRDDTLVLVTADHETGGLKVLENKGKGELPVVSWSSGGHTGANVPVYAKGPGANRVRGVMMNTDIFWIITGRADEIPRHSSVVEKKAASPQPVAAH